MDERVTFFELCWGKSAAVYVEYEVEGLSTLYASLLRFFYGHFGVVVIQSWQVYDQCITVLGET
jgi:hypothetical protein